MNYCQCGCGESISHNRKFKAGHNLRCLSVEADALRIKNMGLSRKDKPNVSILGDKHPLHKYPELLEKQRQRMLLSGGPMKNLEVAKRSAAARVGQKRSEQTKKLISESKLGDKNPICKHPDRHPKNTCPDWRKRISEGLKKYYAEHPEAMEKWLLARLIRPTSLENKMTVLIAENDLPLQYVGDGNLIIGGKNPDFVCVAKNKLVEIFGKYWHTPTQEILRTEHFSKYGYTTLILWEDELDNMPAVLAKIICFLN